MKNIFINSILLRVLAILCGFGAVIGWLGWWASGDLKGWGVLVLILLSPLVFGGVLLGIGGILFNRRRGWPRVLISVGAAFIAANLSILAGRAIVECPLDLLSGFERQSNSCVDYATEGLPIAIYISATIYVGIAVWFLRRPPIAA